MPILHVLFLASGFTALVFEVLWLRGFAIILGSTIQSMSCVLTAFMLGLTVGGALAARLLLDPDSVLRRRPVLSYGVLELVIGGYGLLLTPSLFLFQDRWLHWVARTTTGSPAVDMVCHFALTLVATLVPTVCMGATLPVLCGALRRDSQTPALYGSNTLGAAIGALLASFVLIFLYGCLVSAVVVAVLNGLLFLSTLLIDRGTADGAPDHPALTEDDPTTRLERDTPTDAPFSGPALLALAFLSGFTFFSLELIWNRILFLILGNRIYVTSITLGLVLFCLGIGAWLSRSLLASCPPRRVLIGAYAVAILSCVAALYLEGPALIPDPPAAGSVALFILLLIVVPAVAIGIGFPLLLACREGAGGRGSHVGRVYAANTAGAICGSLLTGYVALNWLGSNQVILIDLILLAAAAWLVGWRLPSGARPAGPLPVLVPLLALITTALHWNRPLTPHPVSECEVLSEGPHGVFTMTRSDAGHLRVALNSTELVFHAGHPYTQYVQESQAHAPLLFAPHWKRVLVIGSGYGITAGTFARYAEVGKVDAVEILPAMIEHADRFAPYHHDYQHSPKVEIHVADGRHFLALQSEPYDIISINVSDPYLPGSASLFSEEFYELVTRRLKPGGVVCQHLFGPDVASLLAGFQRWFPHLRAVPAYAGEGLSVVGGRLPLEPVGSSRMAADPAADAMLRDIGIEGVTRLLEVVQLGAERLAAAQAEPVLFRNSDAHPALEFRRSERLDLLLSNH